MKIVLTYFLELVQKVGLCFLWLYHYFIKLMCGYVGGQNADYSSLFNPGWIAWIIGGLIFIPGVYAMYSVRKYFGFLRAAGTDHFDPSYRNMPFEKRGIFKWFSNAMYVFGIGLFFSFAFISGSKAMFVFADYSYISIWLHYFCTEKEDFKVIYGNA